MICCWDAAAADTMAQSGDPDDQSNQRYCVHDSQNNDAGLNLVLILLGRHSLAPVNRVFPRRYPDPSRQGSIRQARRLPQIGVAAKLLQHEVCDIGATDF